MKQTLISNNVNRVDINPLVNGIFMIRNIMIVRFHKINVWLSK